MLVVLVLVVVLSSVNSYQCSSRYVTKLLRSSLRSSSSSTTTTASSSWQEDIDSILNIDTTCDNRRDKTATNGHNFKFRAFLSILVGDDNPW